MELAPVFGLILRNLRLEKNLSQVELAEASGLDRTFISLLERGIRQPSLDTIFRLATTLKVRPSELLKRVETHIRQKRWRRLRV